MPVVIIAVGGLIFWRYNAPHTSLTTPATTKEEPIEVPKTLPQVSPEIKILPSPTAQPNTAPDPKLNTLEAQVTELKSRVSALEKATPAPQTASQSVIYIPLGAGGVWTNTDWQSLPEYEISLNPDNFPNYSGMTIEATFRLDDPSGTASVRLYNMTDSSATSSQLDSTSTTYTLKSSSSFKLASGTKTYRLQVKSSGGKNLFIQTARIKVNF